MKKSFKLKNPNFAPLYSCVNNYVKAKNVRFHMPSHKGKIFNSLYDGSDFDITELDFSDNLLSSNGVIKQAEELLAIFYSVDTALMFTSGSTTAIFASIFVAKKLGGKILLSKNSHKSVFNAISTLKIEPVFCEVDYDENGFPMPVSPEKVEEALSLDNDIKSVLITSPDYFGRVCDLEKIRAICKDVLLISDSAHGAHFAFTDDLTCRAELVADITIMSMHKTLPCFTGSAIATCKDKWSDALKRAREIFHTTSPYYPAMISMDYVRACLGDCGKELFKLLKAKLSKIQFLKTYDYTKLLLKGGEKLSDFLKKNGIFPECVFGNYVLCIVLPWDIKNLKKLCKLLRKFEVLDDEPIVIPAFGKGERVMRFDELSFVECEWIDIEKSFGRISAKEIGLYPPGVPTVIRGEIIDEKRLKILLENKKSLFGVDSGRIYVVK